jgi:hypothetical protein
MIRLQAGPTSGASHSSRPHAEGDTGPLLALQRDADLVDLPGDRDVAAMRAAYRATGGIARGEDLARWLEEHELGDFVTLARLIVSGAIFSFEWQDGFWIPMFQFDLHDLSVRPGPQQVLAELAADFDGWSLAVWFAKPNSWLADRRPVDLLASNLDAVRQAARADRFIAAG